ncbi:MAG: flagellar hook-length control protein FliK [Deltaproteobacteria bacterium]|nr:flagellar hook-length control protein FliK [Deltaproteobacteria bacterium]
MNAAVAAEVDSIGTPAADAAMASSAQAAVNTASADSVINAAKSNTESAPAADIVIPPYVPTVADTAAANVAVGAAKINTANATAAAPSLSSNTLTVNTAAAANVAVDATPTNTVNTTAADVAQPVAVSAGENTVKIKGNEEGAENTGDTDETDEAKGSEEGNRSSVLAYISEQAAASAIATPSQKVTEKAVDGNPLKAKEDNSKSTVTDGARSTLPRAREEANNAAPEVKAGLAEGSLKTAASFLVTAHEAAPSENKTDLMHAEAGKGRQDGGQDKVVSETAEIKVHADEKKLFGTGAADLLSKKTDSATDGSPEPKLVQPAHAPADTPVKETREAVQHHRNLPVNATVDPLRADNVNAGAVNREVAPESHVSALYANTAPYGSDGSERRDDNAGKDQETLKADGVKSGAEGVFQSNNEKFKVETVDAKPAEAVRTEAVYEKLETGVKMSLARGGSEISLRLTPEHLGALHIKLSVDEGSVKARIVVESNAAKTVLDSDSARLKEVFAAQGLSLDRYTIELGVNSYSAGANPFSENGAKGEMYNRQSAWNRGEDKNEQAAEAKPYRWSENTRKSVGGVDLFV